MPRTISRRSFTACWTCRRRNVRCDTTVPKCLQCERLGIPCEGYQMRLVWVDSKTGDYTHRQRRAYLCDITWKGYPSWTFEDISHLIDDCEHKRCQCKLHEVPSPFHVFPQKREETEASASENGDTTSEPLHQELPSSNEPKDCDQISLESSHKTTKRPISSRGIDHRKVSIDSNMSIIRNPSQSLTLSGSHKEDRLFYHYVSYLSAIMVPIDDGHNPWKSTYPGIAVQDPSSRSARSLYHTILAQSAWHLSCLKGPERGASEKASSIRYFGMAVRELRESLSEMRDDYSSVLAALHTVTVFQHVFQGESRGWRQHLRGAMGLVAHYLTQRPWMVSQDALVVTQNFVLSTIIAQTVGSYSVQSTEHISDVHSVLSDVMTRPNFGNTFGITTRMVEAIYQTRRLEEQIITAGYTQGTQDMDDNMLKQVEDILQKLQTPLNDEVKAYMGQQGHNIMIFPRTQTLAKLHFNIFNRAIMIYLFRMVLGYPPSAVAHYVWEVLTDTLAYAEMNGATLSIWPFFIAAAEAYTPESKALADHLLVPYGKSCVENRKNVQRVIYQLWEDRKQMAAELHCDEGEILLSWRQVMERLDTDILLI